MTSADGVLKRPGQRGALEYTSNGIVRVSIRRDEKMLKSLGLNLRLGNIEYRGRFEVNEANHSISHHIEESNEAERIGKTLIRQYELSDDRLEIIGMGIDGKVKLTWARGR